MTWARPAVVCSALAASALLVACGSGPAKPQPLPLAPIEAPLAVSSLWTQRIGGASFPLGVAVDNGVFTVASDDGTVLALDAASGREIWRGNAEGRLSAGVGSDGQRAAVVTRDGVLVVIEAGAVLWRQPVGARVTSVPLVAGGRVFVLGTDRSVHAFDAADGLKLWTVRRPGDPLTLTQGGVLMAFGNTLLAGQGPRLAALDADTGSVVWEVPLATPRGTNEVERLADLVAPASRHGDVVCARSFQAAVACVNAARGALLWTRAVGGTDGVAGDSDQLVAADAIDRVTAWRAGSGEVAWTQESLIHRGLGHPSVVGPSVLIGSVDGTVHVLSLASGRPVARLATDGSAVTAPPAISGNVALVTTRNGGLHAFRLP